MSPIISFTCRAITAVAILTVTASGEVLYDNGGPNHNPSPNGFEMTQWIEADDFSLATEARVDAIIFWDVELLANFQGTVLWQIYANNPDNTPGTLLYSGSANSSHVQTPYAAPPFAEYLNSFSIPPVVLGPGTYWLALHNGPLSNYFNQRVYWESSGASGARPSQSDMGPLFPRDWGSNSVPPGAPSELAFQITGAPAPRVTSIVRTSTHPQISFTTASGYTYRVEYKNSLSDLTWTAVSGAEQVSGSGAIMAVADPNANTATLSRRFYRVVLL
jgi:hypothetical protein